MPKGEKVQAKERWTIVRRVGLAVALPLAVPLAAPELIVPMLRHVTLATQRSTPAATAHGTRITVVVGLRG